MTNREAIKIMKIERDHMTPTLFAERIEAIDMAISALQEPERKPGKWICSDDLYETAVCSCCGWDTTEPWQHIKSWFEFCPHCGADMRTR